MFVVGLDPGTHATGYCFLGRSADKKVCIERAGTLIAGGKDRYKRILEICYELTTIIRQHNLFPALLVTEDSFVRKNVQTAIVLGEMRGALIHAAYSVSREMNVMIMTPMNVRRHVGLKSNADKHAVARIMHLLLDTDSGLDTNATDAVALAYCGAVKLNWM